MWNRYRELCESKFSKFQPSMALARVRASEYIGRCLLVFGRPMSRGKLPIQNHLYTPKLGTQYPVTKVTSDDVTMMTSWWNTSGMFIMSKISTIYIIMTSSANEKRSIFGYCVIFLKSHITCGS